MINRRQLLITLGVLPFASFLPAKQNCVERMISTQLKINGDWACMGKMMKVLKDQYNRNKLFKLSKVN